MHLTQVTIEAYKTIASSQEIQIDPKITVLLGANESGKTNVLRAIENFSLEKELKTEDICKARSQLCIQKTLPNITFTFSLSQEEIAKISEMIPELSNEKNLVLRKHGNGTNGYSVIFSEEKIKKVLLSKKSLLSAELEQAIVSQNDVKKDIAAINLDISKTEAEYNETRAEGMAVSKIRERMGHLQAQINDRRNLLDIAEKKISDIRTALQVVEKDLKNSGQSVLNIDNSEMKKLISLLPNISFFNNFQILPDSMPIYEILQQDSPRAKMVADLLKLGEIQDLSILNEEPKKLKHILKLVSLAITKYFSKSWTQEPLQIEIEKQGDYLTFSINEGISVSSSPAERSEGFQWLLSFFSHFAAESKSKLRNQIILLDEPAVLLHPRGQKDVVQLLEDIAEYNQIIYTTHSPFLINKNFPQRIRVLTKDPVKGTLINNKPYSDGKTKFWEPLKSSIGVCLGDLFSLSEVNLIVEGVSDQIIITGISNMFAELGYPFIDLEKVSVVPAMGATCEESLARFASSEKLKAISLVDNDSKGKRVLKSLQKDKQIKCLSISNLKEDAVTIEDLIPKETYINSVNSIYSRFDDFKKYKDEEEDKTAGIVEKIDKHLEKLGYEFDKVAVAKDLIQNLEINQSTVSLYDPFKELINQINKL